MFSKKKNRITPDFLKGFDGYEAASFKIEKAKKKISKEINLGKKKIDNKKKETIKRFYKLEKLVWKKLSQEHDNFEYLLNRSERKLKSIRQELLLSKPKKVEKEKPERKWYQSLFSFFLILLFLVIPLKLLAYLQVFNISELEKKVVNSSKSAIDNLIGAGEAASSLDLNTAESRFASAGKDFLQANEDMAMINDTLLSLAALSSNPKIKLAAESKKFLKIGMLGANLGQELSQALAGINSEDGNWIKILDDFSLHGHAALSSAKELETQLQRVNQNNLPDEYRDKFSSLSAKVEKLPESLSLIVDNVDKLKTFLGAGRDKRYLLVFQNNAEMRGSGGFLGSYALVDFREGKIRNLEVPGGGSYDTEAGLREKVKAPSPLWLVNPLWHFWDANWWPDWPTTAKNLMWFYEKSDGPSVDGVISFTPSVMEKLLEVTGPIDMTKDYGLVITADNFWQQVELTAERENIVKVNPEAVSHLPSGEKAKPKKIIGDLMAKILEVLPTKLDKDNLIKLLSISEDSLASKQIMFYFKDPELERAVIERNWGGVMAKAPMDYLMVANTNIAGAKTDRVIKENIKHDAVISDDGSIVDTVVITRTHTAPKNEPLVGVRNVDWLRIYVPEGSELLSASGFTSPDSSYFEVPDQSWLENEFIAQTEGLAKTEPVSGTKIYHENGKTVFANWLMVDPGNSVTVKLQYKIPFNIWQREKKNDFLSRLNDWLNPSSNDLYPYSLSVQKQPGAVDEVLSNNLILPEGLSVVWNSKGDGLYQERILDRDQFYSVLVTKK